MLKSKGILFAAAGIILLGVLAFCWAALPPAADAAAEETERVIQVYGEAELSAAPDRAALVLGVETRGETAEEVVEENARLMESVIAALKKLGLKEEQLKTGTYHLHSYREEPVGARTQTEEYRLTYRAMNELNITVDNLEETGRIIDTAISAGANQVQSVRFELKNPEKLKLEALKAATAQAGAKAKAIAGSAGVSLKGIKRISEEMASYTPYRAAMFEAEMAVDQDSAATTPITPGDVTVQARIVAEYSF